MRKKTSEPEHGVSKKAPEKAGTPKFKPSPEEDAALVSLAARVKATAPAPRFKIIKGKRTLISNDHPVPAFGQILIANAFGAASFEFSEGLINQLIGVSTNQGELDERKLNFIASAIKAAKPKDETEAMLLAQMVAVHMAAMTAASQLAQAETIPAHACAESAFTKLTRTYAMQTEALKRYRSHGEQKVTVEHISRDDRGQSTVGKGMRAGRTNADDRAKIGPQAGASGARSSPATKH